MALSKPADLGLQCFQKRIDPVLSAVQGLMQKHLYIQINNSFESKIENNFLPISFNMFWVLKRTVSSRRFF